MSAEFIKMCTEAFMDARTGTKRRGVTPKATHASLPSPISESERLFYYSNLPSRPILVARTSTDPLYITTSWGKSFRITKEMRPVGDHPLRNVWEGNLALAIHRLLDSMNVQWTSTDVVRIGQCGTAFNPPVVLWIGVSPGSLNGQDGVDVALKCRKILAEYGINDVDVEIRESVVNRWAGLGPKLHKPTRGSSFKERLNALGPLTSALGLSICAMQRSWLEGTGGFFVGEGKEKKRLLLVTARHVVLPSGMSSQDDNAHIGSRTGADYRISILSPQAFDKFVDRLQREIGRNTCQASEIEQWMRKLDKKNDSESDEDENENEKKRLHEIKCQERQIALRTVKDLSVLHNDELPRWLIMRNRVIGCIALSPPFQLGAGDLTEEYTEDWAAIEIDPYKVNTENFVGNVIDLSGDFDMIDITRKMPPSFVFPYDDGLLRLEGVISDEELRAEPTELDERVNEPLGLIVLKRGSGTGLTLGRANNVCSYVRTTYSDSMDKSSSPSTTKVSKEWPILPFNVDLGGFAGKGDSGAVVADGQRRFVGMLTGGTGRAPDEEGDLAYMTPISFLLKRMSQNGLMDLDLDPKLEI